MVFGMHGIGRKLRKAFVHVTRTKALVFLSGRERARNVEYLGMGLQFQALLMMSLRKLSMPARGRPCGMFWHGTGDVC